MKTKCIAQKPSESYKFFLTMIVPLWLGLIVFFISFAQADWDKDDPLLSHSPSQQGWEEVKGEVRTSL